LLDDRAALERQDREGRADAVLTWRVRMGVDVHLQDVHLVTVLLGELGERISIIGAWRLRAAT